MNHTAGTQENPVGHDGDAGGTALAVLVEEVARILDRPPARLGPDLHLQHDLGFDSVMLLQLKGRLETRFEPLREAALPDMLLGVQTLAALAGRLERLTGLPVA
ncbi:acyl carrier protein [Streptomyces sp. NPDC002144]|uniref:acyl carrier protein n=1 Tax=Streptomyces sp. NPDC006668 TaxID=3156903 RepID=UPI0033D33F99